MSDPTEPVYGSNGGMSIHALFNYYYGDGLEPDAGPYDVRARLIFLGRRWQEAQLERTISQAKHGKSRVGIWNNLLSMLDREISITEAVNMSLMNERRVLYNET